MTAVSSVLGFVAVPVATSIGGSVIASTRPAGERVRSIVQHVAAGLVFAAASLELLPDLVREHSQIGTVVGFVAGVAVMLLLGRMSATATFFVGFLGILLISLSSGGPS